MAIAGRHVLITGGAGFIGTTLARILAEANTIVLYDNLHRDALSQTVLSEHPNVRFVQGDVLDRDRLRDAADGASVFIHLAAIAGVDAVLHSPVRTMRVNLLGTANAVDVASELGGSLERFIDFST